MLAGRPRRALVVPALLLGLILLVAAWLRVSGHNWDQGQQINVDDSYVSKVALKKIKWPSDATLGTLLDPQHSPLNPRTDGEFFVYGALPIYLAKGVSSTIYAVTGDPYFNGLGGIQQTGRILTALFDTLTTLLVFAIGARLWGVRSGLLASALYALAIVPIEFSHFFITDPFMTTFMTATLLSSIIFYQTRRNRFILIAGLCAGLAMACKVSAALVLVLPVAAILIRLVIIERAELSRSALWRRALAWGGMALGGAFVGLFIGDPFAVLDASTYLGVLTTQAAIQSGDIDQWFSRKYVGTWPVLHLWGQLMLIGVGPLVGLAGTAGIGVSIVRTWRERRWVDGLLLVGAGSYFASIALVDIKWVRYLTPLVPYLCLFATFFCLWLYRLASKQGRGPLLKSAVPAALLASALLGAIAVSTIFRTEHTQIEASRWIYDNVPAGSRVGIEKTALLMPLALPGHKDPKKEYSLVEMDPLDDKPSAEEAAILHDQLRDVDYLVLDSTQALSTVPRLPWRYPVQIRYYDLLLSGQLGFSVALHSTSYPRIGGLEIPDDGGWVDLSFMDSSHPPIWILKKERTLSDGEWAALFADAVRQPSVASRQKP